MTTEEKARLIKGWIDPDERVTVDFHNAQGLNGEVTGCTEQVVDLVLETTMPHLRQELSLPLRLVELDEDRTHYTRDPARPLAQGRLRLRIDMDRPAVIY